MAGQSCGHPRIKLKKNVLWSGDLKASLRIATKKLIHKTSSNVLPGPGRSYCMQ